MLLVLMLTMQALQGFSAVCSCVGSIGSIFLVSTIYTSGSSCGGATVGCRITYSQGGQSGSFWGDADDCATTQAASSCFNHEY